MRRHATLAALACCLLPAAGAAAAEVAKLPASGKARIEVSYVQWAPAREITLGDQAGIGAMEFAGITRNTDGKPWFDRMTEHCSGQFFWGEHNAAPGTGTCLYLDADGDQVMVNFTLTQPYGGTKQIVGGTGKYAGITGQGTFTGTQLKPPATGMDLFVLNVELDFQIKSATQ
ncbi:MAG: hypothetical protein U1E45_10395 [Geminicoccaceae bacterium]